MDPFSSESELVNIYTHFHQGQYQQVVDFDTSSFSPENALPARVLQLRARIALGQAADVLKEVSGGQAEPELAAVAALAQLRLGRTEAAVQAVEKLAVEAADNATVQVLGGTVLQAAGKSKEAMALLSQHQSNLEAVALIVQIHLHQNRIELASKEVAAAKKWAQDSILVNLAEAWVGMRIGGEKYQEAFYVFEELASDPDKTSTRSLVSQAICEMHLGRMEEAQTALDQAVKEDDGSAEAVANMLVYKVMNGEKDAEYLEMLKKINPKHRLLVDMEEKSAFFDKAATKYKPSVTSVPS